MTDKYTYQELEQRVHALETSEFQYKKKLKLMQKEKLSYKSLFINMLHEVHVWELVFDDAGDIVTWKLVDANPAALKSWGKDLSEIAGKTTDEIFPNSNATELFLPIVKKIFKENKPHVWESYFPDTDQLLHMVSFPFDKHFISTGLDVTESRKIDQAVRDHESQLEAIYNNSRYAIGVSVKGIHVAGNPAYANLFGYKDMDEILGKPILDLIAPESREQIADRAERRVQGRDAPDFYETRGLRKDGSVFDMEVTASTFSLQEQFHTLVILRDITDRKTAEEKRLRDEKDLKESQRIAKLGSWRMNVQTNEVYWTEELFRMYGLDPNLPAPPYTEHMKLFTPESWEQLSTSLAKTVETGAPYELVLEMVRPDGGNGWMRVRGEAISDESGKIVELWGAAQDITEDYLAHQALRESEAMLANIASQVPGMIYQFRMEPDGAYSVPYSSHRINDIFGCSPEDVRNDFGPILTAIHPEDRNNLLQTIGESAKHMSPWMCEFRVQAPGQSIKWMFANSIPEKKADGSIVWSGHCVDITERKQAEEALLASRDRFSALFDQAPVAIWEEDFSAVKAEFDRLRREGVESFKAYFQEKPEEVGRLAGLVKILDVNRASLESFGIADKEELDLNLPRYFTEESLEVFARELVALAEGNTFFSSEIPIVDLQGRARTLDLRLTVCPRCKDTLSQVLASFLDITARQQAEKELRESKLFLENLSDIAYVADDKGNLIWVNPAGEKMTGLILESMIGQSFLPLFIEEDQASLIDVYQRTLWGESLENTLTFKSGITCHFTSLPRRDDDGKIVGTFGIARDITERLNTEKALQTSETRLKTAQAVANIGSWEFDVTTGKVWGSEEAFRIYGLARKSAYLPLDEVENRITEPKRVNQALVDLITKGRNYDIEFQITPGNREGLTTIHSIAELVKDDEGNPIKVVGVIHDITELKEREREQIRLQEQLQQAQKMEAIGTLAGGIAHDFNNILSAIMGYSELALDMASTGETAPDELRRILSSAERAKDLVTQILTFSRRVKSELKPIDLNNVVHQTEQMLERTIPRMVKIDHHLVKNLWSINADPGQMTQVVMNLGTNASDAMPDGGTMTIETENLHLDQIHRDQHIEVPPGEYVRLTVSDTGLGMSEETLEHIFDPFFTTKAVTKGTGLGLATVYGIVKNHGGHIDCSSELGRGTSFKVYLPAQKEMTAPKPDKAAIGNKIERGAEKILLVDDDEMLRDLGSRILTGQGYRVSTAESGEEALEKYAAGGKDVDLVILDISMPGMGGHKCLQELLKLNPQVKVIISSGYSLSGQLGDIMDQGASGFVPKPFGRLEMLEAIRRVLDA